MSNEMINRLKDGWSYAGKIAGELIAAKNASGYIEKISDAIDTLNDDLLALNCNQTDAVMGGFVAEVWHADTFNINAIASGSINRARRPAETGYGSVDIATNFGKTYSSKYISTPKNSVEHQSVPNKFTGKPLYEGQERLIPSDQLEEGLKYAHRKALKEEYNRPEVSKALKDTEIHLTDRVKDENRCQSTPLSKKDSINISRDIKNENLNLDDYGINLKSVINDEFVQKEALKYGCKAAVLSIIWDLIPELMIGIKYLVDNKEIDVEHLKKAGIKTLSDGAESFLRGFLTHILTILCKKGVLGKYMAMLPPEVITIIVSVLIDAVKEILLAMLKHTSKKQKAVVALFLSGGVAIIIPGVRRALFTKPQADICQIQT